MASSSQTGGSLELKEDDRFKLFDIFSDPVTVRDCFNFQNIPLVPEQGTNLKKYNKGVANYKFTFDPGYIYTPDIYCIMTASIQSSDGNEYPIAAYNPSAANGRGTWVTMQNGATSAFGEIQMNVGSTGPVGDAITKPGMLEVVETIQKEAQNVKYDMREKFLNLRTGPYEPDLTVNKYQYDGLGYSVLKVGTTEYPLKAAIATGEGGAVTFTYDGTLGAAVTAASCAFDGVETSGAQDGAEFNESFEQRCQYTNGKPTGEENEFQIAFKLPLGALLDRRKCVTYVNNNVSVTLTRALDADILEDYTNPAATDGKRWLYNTDDSGTPTALASPPQLVINDLYMYVPYIIPAPQKSAELEVAFPTGIQKIPFRNVKLIEETILANTTTYFHKETYSLRPVLVVVGFQKPDQINKRHFTNGEIESIQVDLGNNQIYPTQPFKVENWDNNRQTNRLYEAFKACCDSPPAVSFEEWLDHYTLYMFDTSRDIRGLQELRVETTPVTVKAKFVGGKISEDHVINVWTYFDEMYELAGKECKLSRTFKA